MTGNIWESYMCTAVKIWDISGPRRYEHYWTSSWNETWKKFRPVPGFEPIYKISAIGKSVSGLQRFMYWLLNAF